MQRPQQDQKGLQPESVSGVQDRHRVSRNKWVGLALLAISVAFVFCCLCSTLAESLPSGSPRQYEAPAEAFRTATGGDAARQTPMPSNTATSRPSDTPKPAVEQTAESTPATRPDVESTVVETPIPRPTMDTARFWLQYWDEPGSTFDPEGWFKVAELTWEAVDSAARSGDRQAACGYSVRYKIREAESALDAAPAPGSLEEAEQLLRHCIIFWRDAADSLAFDCQFSSGLPETYRMNMIQGQDALDAARQEIEAYRESAGMR
jgi:hypothetical protein